VHPGDAHVPRLLTSIDATFGAFGRRRPARYADLLSATSSEAEAASIVQEVA
jgi:hypothetical protein